MRNLKENYEKLEGKRQGIFYSVKKESEKKERGVYI
jgi:hypothetical protein